MSVELTGPLHAKLARLWRAPGRWFWPGLWLGVFAASLWQYRGTLSGDFEDYDVSRASRDSQIILRFAREPSPLGSFARPLTPTLPFYRPGTVVWFWLEARVLGYRPSGWRVTTIACHAVVITLLALLVAIVSGSRAPAVLAAAWFLWRGEHHEVLTWIPTQPDLAVAALSLAALVVLWRVQWPWRWRAAGSAGLGLAAFLTKESAAFFFPFVAITAPLWPVREGAKMRLWALGGFVVAGLVYLAGRHMALGPALLGGPGQVYPPLGTGLRAYLQIVWPPAPALVLLLPSLQLGWIVLLATPFWRLVWQHLVYYGGAVVLARRAWRPALLFAIWILVTPLPMIRTLTLGTRFEYLPSMGWAGLAGLLLWQVGRMALRCTHSRRQGGLAPV